MQASGQVALTPSGPAISPGAAFAPAISPPVVQNQVTTNATLGTLSASLMVLQTNLQQTLPILILFNDSFDFVSLANTGLGVSGTANPPGNFGSNLGSNFAQNFGANAAVSTGGSLFNSPPVPSNVNPTASPQSVPAVAISPDALRALIVLQSDIQRMLPLVNALNGGTTNAPGSFTNLVGVPPTGP